MGVGECWGSLRGPLRQYFSFSDIKEIAGAAGLAVQRLGHLQQKQGPGGASKPQLLDELDLLFAEKSPEDQDRITTATIREMVRLVHPSRLQGMEDQTSAALAAHGWGLRSGEAYPLPPPGRSAGMGSPPVRAVDARAGFAAATGVNEIPTPLREAAAFNSSGSSGAVGGASVNTSAVNGGPPSAGPMPTFGTGYNEGEDDYRDAAGNVLADAEVADLDGGGNPILDSDGEPILDSDGNPILDSGSAVALPVDTVTFTVSSGPPPEVPEPGPALIEPEWLEHRLTLPKRLPANDLWDGAVESLVAAVRADFAKLIEALAGTNFDPALRRAIEGVPELLTGVPGQARVFQMGHAVEHLEALQAVADEELPEGLRVQYRTLVGQFRRLVEQFPAWRALTLKAEEEPLTEEQAAQAVPVARELAAVLSTEAAAEVADREIGVALSGLADAAEAASGPERALLDFDLIASVEQIMTKLMKPVADCWAYCWKEYGAGMAGELKKLPREAGAGTVKWGKRTLIKIAAMVPPTAFASHLAATYPNLSWLPALVALLTFIASSPKD